jgi:hypothetical protein
MQPDDVQDIFITIPKTPRAQRCSHVRTISLISRTSQILLHFKKERITPISEKHMAESQIGFSEGKGTRDVIFQLRTIAELEYRFIRRFIPVLLITRKFSTGLTMKSR